MHKPPLTVKEAIELLLNRAHSCETDLSYATAEAACKATRLVWDAIHNQANFRPFQLTKVDVQSAISGVRRCIDALRRLDVALLDESQQIQVKEGFLHNMSVRLDMLQTLHDSGLKEADKKITQFLSKAKASERKSLHLAHS